MAPLTAISSNADRMAKAATKRKHEVIDLTGEVDSLANQRDIKHVKTQSSHAGDDGFSRPHAQSSQDDEADLDEIIATQTVAGDSRFAHLYGVLETKVVGVRYYNGLASQGESVLLRREPHNAYDRNAIRVDNVSSQQIGHIPRTVAVKLAHYFDQRLLSINGRLTDILRDFDGPVELELVGPDPESAEGRSLMAKMKEDRLPLQKANELIRGRKHAQKAEEQQRKQQIAEARRAAATGNSNGGNVPNSSSQYANMSQPGFDDAPRLQDIVDASEKFDARAFGKTESYGQDETVLKDMPLARQPQAVSTTMLPHQLQALQWLLGQESPVLPSQGSNAIVQLWKRHTKHGDAYTNIATSHSTRETPVLARGGILADDMGLGKTLEMIALIIEDKKRFPSEAGPTLVVAPLSVMSNWVDQMQRHVLQKHALKPFIFHGKQAGRVPAEDFLQYDVVITTYQTLASDYASRGQQAASLTKRKHGLYSLSWRRVILDEGHIVRNPHTKGAAAVMAVKSTMRWALTGTPIVNSLRDLYCLLKFVGVRGGLEHQEVFNTVLVRPLSRGDRSAVDLLQATMKAFALRRKKEMEFIDLKLPPLEEYVQRLDFSKDEQRRYDALKDEADGVIKSYMDSSAAGVELGSQFQTLLTVLLRMRQCCNHWTLCGERVNKILADLEKNSTVKLTSDNVNALQDLLQVGIQSQDDCAVCLEPLHAPVITHCGHAFGKDCIVKVIDAQGKCPMCRAELKDESCLVEARNDCGDDEKFYNSTDNSTSSTKVDALINILKATKAEGQGEKTIVFSQWTRFLDVIQKELEELGFNYTRLDGTMSASERDESLLKLEQDSGCTIMLASLGVCAVGLNLVAANNIILSDSWWAPAIEDQAVDRVHRLGQRRATRVFRLVMDKSIEDSVLKIQADKRSLMKMALSERHSKRDKVKQGRLADIKTLLGWT